MDTDELIRKLQEGKEKSVCLQMMQILKIYWCWHQVKERWINNVDTTAFDSENSEFVEYYRGCQLKTHSSGKTIAVKRPRRSYTEM